MLTRVVWYAETLIGRDLTCESLMLDMTWESNRFWIGINVCDLSLPKRIWYLTRVPVDRHILIKLCARLISDWNAKTELGVASITQPICVQLPEYLKLWPISRILYVNMIRVIGNITKDKWMIGINLFCYSLVSI